MHTQSIFTWLLYLNNTTVSFVEYHANVTNVAAIISKKRFRWRNWIICFRNRKRDEKLLTSRWWHERLVSLYSPCFRSDTIFLNYDKRFFPHGTLRHWHPALAPLFSEWNSCSWSDSPSYRRESASHGAQLPRPDIYIYCVLYRLLTKGYRRLNKNFCWFWRRYFHFAQLPLVSFMVGEPSETVVKPLQVGSPDWASK